MHTDHAFKRPTSCTHAGRNVTWCRWRINPHADDGVRNPQQAHGRKSSPAIQLHTREVAGQCWEPKNFTATICTGSRQIQHCYTSDECRRHSHYTRGSQSQSRSRSHSHDSQSHSHSHNHNHSHSHNHSHNHSRHASHNGHSHNPHSQWQRVAVAVTITITVTVTATVTVTLTVTQSHIGKQYVMHQGSRAAYLAGRSGHQGGAGRGPARGRQGVARQGVRRGSARVLPPVELAPCTYTCTMCHSTFPSTTCFVLCSDRLPSC